MVYNGLTVGLSWSICTFETLLKVTDLYLCKMLCHVYVKTDNIPLLAISLSFINCTYLFKKHWAYVVISLIYSNHTFDSVKPHNVSSCCEPESKQVFLWSFTTFFIVVASKWHQIQNEQIFIMKGNKIINGKVNRKVIFIVLVLFIFKFLNL